MLYRCCTGGVVYSEHKWVRVSRVWVLLEQSRVDTETTVHSEIEYSKLQQHLFTLKER